MDEALEWLKRAPFDRDTEVEIRPLYEAEDFGPELTAEMRQHEQRMRDLIAAEKS